MVRGELDNWRLRKKYKNFYKIQDSDDDNQ